MGALAIPKSIAISRTNHHLCKRIGVKFNGQDMGQSVLAYNVEKGTVTVRKGQSYEILSGVVEPYWRNGI